MQNYLTWILLLISLTSFGSDLKITNVLPVFQPDLNKDQPYVLLDIHWNNSWNNDKNHDAVWLFAKFSGFYNNHVKWSLSGHGTMENNIQNPELNFKVSPDQNGIMLSTKNPYRGNIHCRIRLTIDTTNQELDRGKLNGLEVFGLEMVYIPGGPFTLGSPDEAGIEKAAFYKSNASGNPDGLIRITSEDRIEVGPEEGSLYYWSRRDIYNGDQQGPVPSLFPKGFNDFYIMKYEVTQGQYAAFLNKLPDNDTYMRSPIAGRNYYEHRGTIQLVAGNYIAQDPHRPMNYISWVDGMAFTDWAALRPITELEYTKAARGPVDPIPFEMVWGTDNINELERWVQSNGGIYYKQDLDESDLSDNNRSRFGASYYWVMGSQWECLGKGDHYW